jgi:hypothetical protein
MKPLRFRLSALLLLITAVAAFFGFAQWRRQSILLQVNALKAEGVQLEAPNTWWDLIWQRPPATAWHWAHSKEFEERLDKLGVENFRYWITY